MTRLLLILAFLPLCPKRSFYLAYMFRKKDKMLDGMLGGLF